jgi:hypothetical protein
VLSGTFDRPQKIPWRLYDPQFLYEPSFNEVLCERLSRDFISEAELRGVPPEMLARSSNKEVKGRLYRRTIWKDIHSE